MGTLKPKLSLTENLKAYSACFLVGLPLCALDPMRHAAKYETMSLVGGNSTRMLEFGSVSGIKLTVESLRVIALPFLNWGDQIISAY